MLSAVKRTGQLRSSDVTACSPFPQLSPREALENLSFPFPTDPCCGCSPVHPTLSRNLTFQNRGLFPSTPATFRFFPLNFLRTAPDAFLPFCGRVHDGRLPPSAADFPFFLGFIFFLVRLPLFAMAFFFLQIFSYTACSGDDPFPLS